MTAEEQLEADALELANAFPVSAGEAFRLRDCIVALAKNYLNNIDEERSLDAQGDALDRGL